MTKLRKTYYLFHILNDFSGSPKVLRQVAETLLLAHEVVIVSSDSEGFLTNIAGAKYRKISYAWSPKKWLTLLNFCKVQLVLFFKALFLPKGTVVYVNTLLPFGAALGGKLRGLEVVYHLHEPQVQPAILFSLLKKVAKITSDKQIYVSHYLESQLNDLWIEKRKVIHNSIPDDFLQKAATITAEKEIFEILMACSLKKYKGVYEFIALASKIPEVSFKLIVNSEGEVFNQFLEQNKVTKNCTVLSAQKNMMQHYAKASVVLNLSDKNEWVESFGLTIIEAMAFGLPVIVPIVGGPVEIIQEGISGYAIDSKNEKELVKKIKLLFTDKSFYTDMSQAAKNRAQDFSNQAFKTKIKMFLN